MKSPISRIFNTCLGSLCPNTISAMDNTIKSQKKILFPNHATVHSFSFSPRVCYDRRRYTFSCFDRHPRYVTRKIRLRANVGMARPHTSILGKYPPNCTAIAASRKIILRIACLIAGTSVPMPGDRMDATARRSQGVASIETKSGNQVCESR